MLNGILSHGLFFGCFFGMVPSGFLFCRLNLVVFLGLQEFTQYTLIFIAKDVVMNIEACYCRHPVLGKARVAAPRIKMDPVFYGVFNGFSGQLATKKNLKTRYLGAGLTL